MQQPAEQASLMMSDRREEEFDQNPPGVIARRADTHVLVAAANSNNGGGGGSEEENSALLLSDCETSGWKFVWRLDGFLLALAVLVFSFAIDLVPPYCRPFSWNDESINYAYEEDTFPDWSLTIVAFGTAGLLALIAHYKPQQCLPSSSSSAAATAANNNAGVANPSERYDAETRAKIDQRLHTGQVLSVLLFFSQAAAFSFLMTNAPKIAAGRLRPDFLSRLRSLGYSSANTTVDWCLLSHEQSLIHKGRLSFPSGHSSCTFFSMTALTLYLLSRLSAFSSRSFLRVLVSVTPLVLSFVVAISRTWNHRHHFTDISVGSLIGILSSLFAWNLHFEKIGERRHHHQAFAFGGGDHVPKWLAIAATHRHLLLP